MNNRVIKKFMKCQEHAKNKNGKLISDAYITAKYKMLWECKEGHQWKACWDSVRRGTWCAKCSKRAMPSITELQEYAATKQGRLISTTYINAKLPLIWECKEKHQWKSIWDNIHRGAWCPKCVGKIKPNIAELYLFAMNNNLKLLTTIYTNNHTKMLWECEKGHQWKASWGHISNGSGCPECSRFKMEYKCKTLLEMDLGFIFKKTRFTYKNNSYEWDGYNEEYKIAFEYHGYQHYTYPNFFQKTKEAHEKAKQRDIEKVKYAKENNIKLIIIPYTENDRLEEYIEEIIK